jgi:hypothetical protein
MDPVKIIIFVAAFLLLLLLDRKLSAMGEVQAFQPSDQPPEPAQPVAALQPPVAALQIVETSEDSDGPRRPAMMGSELPFPVPLPELKQDADGKYNRPEFINYYFGKIDLVLGPPDHTAFVDDFFVEARIPEQYVTTYKYVVCTPAGIERMLDSKRLPSLCVDNPVIFFSRWDLPLILNTVVKEIIEGYQDVQSDDDDDDDT